MGKEKAYTTNQVAVADSSEAPKAKKKKSKADIETNGNENPEKEESKPLKKKKSKANVTEEQTEEDATLERKKSKSKMKKEEEKNQMQDLLPMETPMNYQLNHKIAEKLCREVRLTMDDIKRMQQRFDKVDFDLSGELVLEEFLEMLNEKESVYLTRILTKILQKEKFRRITFGEYVAIVITMCRMSKADILRFSFEMYDTDGSGALDEKEFIFMCTSLHPKEQFFGGNFQKAMTEFDKNKDGFVDFDEFMTLNSSYPMIFYPILRFQETLQKNSLGKARWLTILKRNFQIEQLTEYMKIHKGSLPRPSLIDNLFGSWNGSKEIRRIAIQEYRKLSTSKPKKK